MYFNPSRPFLTISTLVCLAVGQLHAGDYHASGYSKGPHIESGSFGGDFDFSVKTQPTSETERRFLSLLISTPDRNQPTLAFSIVLDDANAKAEVTDVYDSKTHGVAAWTFRVTIDGHPTTLIYQVKDNGDGKFTDVLAIANRAVNLDEGRLIEIGTLDDDGGLDRVSQAGCRDDLKFIVKMKQRFRRDLNAVNADMDDWEPEP
ncbi:hypothetical protein [Rhodopirellula sp. P2]|uniref:hypothetical protein n=1 Tax=Rhodopirellula sp. P2 TaxID=2127060 RepID=UPI0023683E9D|nr:hypothetical protein [Rhodopirellula sp. P2]WDQ16081.1 hypothetical protein PSR62_20970 [Rhodopirellula sp. P2]